MALLLTTDSLPLSLLGEALFDNVDSFALIAIPLFVLTGDVMVRSGLAYKLLDFAEATTGSLRSGFGTSTVHGLRLFRVHFRLGRGRRRRDRPHHHETAGRARLSACLTRARWWRPARAPAS